MNTEEILLDSIADHKPAVMPASRAIDSVAQWMWMLTRFALYLIIPAAIVEILILLAIAGHENLAFKEDSLLEWLQFSVLVAASCVFYVAGRRNAHLRNVLHVIMLLPAIAAVRELDRFLEHVLAEVMWKVLALMIVAYLCRYCFQHYKSLKLQMPEIIHTKSFGLMLAGFFFIMAFSRLIAQKVFMKALMHEGYVRIVAKAVEELSEFAGYCIILAAAIECLYERFDSRRAPPAPPGQ
jgi:hypothetical protein